MLGIVDLHHDLMFFLVWILGFVVWLVLRTVWLFRSKDQAGDAKAFPFIHGSLIEIVWTLTPCVILVVISIPSFSLLYSLDEIVEPAITVKVTGLQWFWSTSFNLFSRSAYTAPFWVACVCGIFEGSIYCASDALGIKSKDLFCCSCFNALWAYFFRRLEEGWLAEWRKAWMITCFAANKSSWSSSKHVDLQNLSSFHFSGVRNKLKVKFHPYLFKRSGVITTAPCLTNQGSIGRFSFSLWWACGRSYSSHASPIEIFLTDRKFKISYSQLCSPEVYSIAFSRLTSIGKVFGKKFKRLGDSGAAERLINVITLLMKKRKFCFKPLSRAPIILPRGEVKFVGVPAFWDKLVLEAYQILLEAALEPIFLPTSHGFRPHKSPFTALHEVKQWNRVSWVITGNFRGFFDNINPNLVAGLLAKHVPGAFVDLYWQAIDAGYVHSSERPYEHSQSRAGTLSSLLSNLYLHSFDQFLKTFNLKSTGSCKAERNWRADSPLHDFPYDQWSEIVQPANPDYCYSQLPTLGGLEGASVFYNRYGSDWMVGVAGSHALAEKVKGEIVRFLAEGLLLGSYARQIKVTHLETANVRYLGFDIVKPKVPGRHPLRIKIAGENLAFHNYLSVEAPLSYLFWKVSEGGFFASGPQNQVFSQERNRDSHFKPNAVTKWVYLPPASIIHRYNSTIRDIAFYYSFVKNKDELKRIMHRLTFSAVLTLSKKLNLSPRQLFIRYGSPLSVNFTFKGKVCKTRLYNPKLHGRERRKL